MNRRDRIVQLIREMTVANIPRTGGGFGSNPPSGMENQVAGFDPALGMLRRTKNGNFDRRVKKRYKNWLPRNNK
jgi:hypothetical protein